VLPTAERALARTPGVAYLPVVINPIWRIPRLFQHASRPQLNLNTSMTRTIGPDSSTRLLRTAVVTVLAAGLAFSASASDWPNWRGPSGTGSTAAGTPPVKWTAEQAAWKVALPGKGSSTPIVWKGKIFLTAPDSGEDSVIAFDLDGKKLWQTKLGPESPPKHRTLGSSCNSSPVTDGKGLFVYFRSGHFAALELDGSVRWKQNLTEQFGAERLYWDQGSSPVVTDQHVILARMHQGESWVAGFDKATGTLKWKQARNYKVPAENDNGYTTPVLFEHAGKKAFLIWGADHVTAHDSADGKLLWSAGGFNPDATGLWPAISTPVVHGNIAVIPVGRDDRPNQGRIHALKLDGSGDVTATHRAWQRDDLGVFVPALTEYGGKVYLLRHRGEVVCLDPTTGKTVWAESLPRSSAPYYSSPVIANGVLYAAREDGVVFAVRVGEKFELLGQNPMGERIMAAPVPVGNRLLIRGHNHLFCIGK
jgi:outer membrane protein assembly factor BamB